MRARRRAQSDLTPLAGSWTIRVLSLPPNPKQALYAAPLAPSLFLSQRATTATPLSLQVLVGQRPTFETAIAAQALLAASAPLVIDNP